MNRRTIAWIAGAFGVLVVAGVAVWWFVLRSDAPPAVSLDSAVEEAREVAGDGSPGGDVAGTWVPLGDGTSFVGYRVEEELASIGFTTAAGRTGDVEGSLVIEGTTVTEVSIVADMTTLRSDSSFRDGAIRRQALETDTFPTASFTLAEPIDLPAGAADGAPFAADAVGDLEIHGVTNRVTIPLEAQLVEGTIVVIGSTEILFADYEIDKPTAAAVLSVDDRGIMEMQLVFTRG